MDPLSLTASIIAILGVSGQVGGVIRKLASVRGAPDILRALNNEITDLRLVVTSIQDAFQRQRTTTLPPSVTGSGYHASITSSLQQALDKVHELEALYHRLRPITPNASGLLKLSPVRWAREQSKVLQLRDDLKIVRLQLLGALETLALYAKRSLD